MHAPFLRLQAEKKKINCRILIKRNLARSFAAELHCIVVLQCDPEKNPKQAQDEWDSLENASVAIMHLVFDIKSLSFSQVFFP